MSQQRRRGAISLEYDSDGTNDSDLDEYNEDNDSVGSLEDFIVSDEEESDYENDEELVEEESDAESVSDADVDLAMPPRRSRRLEGRPRVVVVMSDDEDSEEESDEDRGDETRRGAVDDDINY
jgi:hypothetical protein